MKNILAIALTVYVCLNSCISVFADTYSSQRTRPIPRVDFKVPLENINIDLLGLNSEVNNPGPTGRPTIPVSDRLFYYIPLFAFKADANNEIQISQDNGLISLPLIVDYDGAKQKFSDYLVRQGLLQRQGANDQVQSVGFSYFAVETPEGYPISVRFSPKRNWEPNSGEIILTAVLSSENATKFVTDLKNKRLSLIANMVLGGYTYVDNYALITVDDIKNSNSFRRLVGVGKPGYLSRKNIADITQEALLNRNINVVIEKNDEFFSSLLEKVLQNLQVERRDLQKNWESLDQFFQDQGWDKSELAADLITKSQTLYKEKEILKSQFKQDIERISQSSGGFSFGAVVEAIPLEIGANSSDYSKFADNILRETLKDWGIETIYSEEGKRIIPKSVNLVSSNSLNLLNTTSSNLSVRYKVLGENVISIDLNPRSTIVHSIPSDHLIQQRLDAAISRGVPTGTIVAFSGTTIPAGWYLCDGSRVSKSNSADLYKVLSNQGWSLDYDATSDTFQLPTLEGWFLRGRSGTRKIGSEELDELKRHKHDLQQEPHKHNATITPNPHDHGYQAEGQGPNQAERGGDIGLRKKDRTTSTDLSVTVAAANAKISILDYGTADETRPKNIAVNWIIKN